MFYPEKISSIKPSDKVLEIGPGSTPFDRSDVFLELAFDSEKEKVLQRGGVEKGGEFRDRPVHYYDGKEFPFCDKEFDYVICSHVIEHVEDPLFFLQEVFRVSKGAGYLEYPLIPYEYMYNFNVHLNFIKFNKLENTLLFFPKKDSDLASFFGVNALLYKTLERGWDDLCVANKELFFEGFEYMTPFVVNKTASVEEMLPSSELINEKKPMRMRVDQIIRKCGI